MTTTGRLRGRRTFAAIAQQGRTVRSGPLRVRYLAAAAHHPAVGYAISKKVGGSVVRNRIRRRLRAAVADVEVPLTSGFYLVSADATAAEVPFAQLTEALASAFGRCADGSRS